MADRRYRFGPRDTRGMVAGWSAQQLLAVLLGMSCAVLAARSLPQGVGLFVAVAIAMMSLALPKWSFSGRSAGEWCSVAIAWQLKRILSPRRPAGALCAATVFEGGRLSKGPMPGRATGALAGLSVSEVCFGGRRLGMVWDSSGGRLTAVIALASSPALLGERADRSRLADAWAATLASAAGEGSKMARLQWIQRAMPASLWRFEPEGAVQGPALSSYLTLLAEEEQVGWTQEVFLAVSVASGRGGTERAARDLADEAGRLGTELQRAGIMVLGSLSGPAVAQMLRRSFDTSHRLRKEPGEDLSPDGGGGGSPWPTAIREHWNACQADGTWHAQYFVAEWPRTEVGPDFLAPLLCADVRRSMSVVLEPIKPSRAARQAERARTAEVAEARLASRGGFLTSERRRREAFEAGEKARELAAGHSEYRFAAYVTVTADDRAGLEVAARSIEGAARQVGVDLRRIYGQCARALGYALPCARGL